MKETIRGIDLTYDISGYGEPIILLHGWGVNKSIFRKLLRHLEKDYCIYNLDLPGFGESTIRNDFSFEDYVLVIEEFIERNGLENPILIAHSFGGRVAIRLSTRKPISKLVLISSAGIYHKPSIIKRIKIKLYKLFKKVGIKVKMGSRDYLLASEPLRSVLVEVVNMDQREDLKDIKAKTLIIYGKKDKATKYTDGYILRNGIRDSRFAIFKKSGHYPFLEEPSRFFLTLDSFLSGGIND